MGSNCHALQNVSDNNEATKKNDNRHGQFFYSLGVKLTLMSGEGEALCATGCELAGQPTMVKPVVFKFMAPCSALAWGCGGTAEAGGAWNPLPGAA